MIWKACAVRQQPSRLAKVESDGGVRLADELDRVKDIYHRNSQWHFALMAPTYNGTDHSGRGAASGNGEEAWSQLVTRWDVEVVGRKGKTISPARCNVEALASVEVGSRREVVR